MISTSPVDRSTGAREIYGSPAPIGARAPADAAPPSLLPPPFTGLGATSGDLGAELAAMLLEAGREQRETARQTRASAEAAQRAAERVELEAMSAEANARLVAGWLEGGSKMCAGAIGLAGASGDATAQQRAKSGMMLAEGGGRTSGAIATHYADSAKRTAVAAQQNAARDKRAADDARDLGSDAKDMLERAIGYYEQYLTAKSEAQRAALQRA